MQIINNGSINNNAPQRRPNVVTSLSSANNLSNGLTNSRSRPNPPEAIKPAINQLTQDQSQQLLQGFHLPEDIDKSTDIASISLNDKDNTNSLSSDDSVAVTYVEEVVETVESNDAQRVAEADTPPTIKIHRRVREVILPLEILLKRIAGLVDLLEKIGGSKGQDSENSVTTEEVSAAIMKGVIELVMLETYFMNKQTMEDIKNPYDYTLSS